MDVSDRYGDNGRLTAIPQPGSTIYGEELSLDFTLTIGTLCTTYGSIMNTLEASVRLRATPPALSDTRKTSTSVLFMKNSIDR